MRILNLLGNKFFSFMFTWILNQRFKDTLCGTKALFRKDYERIQRNREYFGDFREFSRLKILKKEKMDCLIYPLSGGFHHRSLFPIFLFPAMDRLEKWFQPMSRFLAFRMLIVLEKG